MRSTSRQLMLCAIAVSLGGGAVMWATWHSSNLDARPAGDRQLAQLSIGGPFTLVDQSGRTVTQADFGGRWLLVYFGYTSCPDVCPTTMQTIVTALNQAGPSAKKVTPLFITVDPARDTPAVLARYTALFDKRIVGLTGTTAQVAAVETAYRVYATRSPHAGGGYQIDHTGFVYLINPTGHLSALFGADTAASTMADQLRANVV